MFNTGRESRVINVQELSNETDESFRFYYQRLLKFSNILTNDFTYCESGVDILNS